MADGNGQRTIRIVSGLLAIVALVAIVGAWGCNDNSLLLGVGAVLIILGKMAVDDLPFFGGDR